MTALGLAISSVDVCSSPLRSHHKNKRNGISESAKEQRTTATMD